MRSASRWSCAVTPSGRVDHEQRDVGLVHGPQRPDERVVLGRIVDAALAPHAGRVDVADGPVGCVDHGVDGVAGGPGQVVDDGAVVADQPVEQRALAHVRPAHDGHGRDRRAGLAGILCAISVVVRLGVAVRSQAVGRGQPGDDLVEEVAGPPAVQRGDGMGLPDAEGEELPTIVLTLVVVGLVHPEQHGLPGAAQPGGDRVVVLGDPDAGVDEEDDQVGAPHGLLHLPADLLVEVAARRQPTPGVDEQEGDAEPLGLDDLAVPGDAWVVLDDGDALADGPVDEGGLPDVGPAHDGDDRRLHHRPVPVRARRRAMPSVGTTSTGRGRSAGVVPSRKRPSDRQTSGSR